VGPLATLGAVEEEAAVVVVEAEDEGEVVVRLNLASRDNRIVLWHINGRNRIRLVGRTITAANSELRRLLVEEVCQADDFRAGDASLAIEAFLHRIMMRYLSIYYFCIPMIEAWEYEHVQSRSHC
jgi:hypothetical protein